MNYMDDSRLSLKAKGLLSLILEHGFDAVRNYTSDRDITINSAINELRKFAYITSVKESKRGEIIEIGLVPFADSQE